MRFSKGGKSKLMKSCLVEGKLKRSDDNFRVLAGGMYSNYIKENEERY